jgi:hypothetical protein
MIKSIVKTVAAAPTFQAPHHPMSILTWFYASHNPKLATRNLSGNLSLVGAELDEAAMHIILKTLRVSGRTPLMGEFTISPIGMVQAALAIAQMKSPLGSQSTILPGD